MQNGPTQPPTAVDCATRSTPLAGACVGGAEQTMDRLTRFLSSHQLLQILWLARCGERRGAGDGLP